MSQIDTVYQCWTCDQPGCPGEFSITRWKRDTDSDRGEISTAEMLDWAKKLGWKVVGEKAFCPDCQSSDLNIVGVRA